MSTEAAAYLAGGAPSFKFDNKGDKVKGVVLATELAVQTDIKTKKPLYWDEERTRVKQQVIVTLQTDLRDSEIAGDDGARRVYVKGQMENAVRQALAAVGWRGKPMEGGELGVKYVKDGEPPERGFNPPKEYIAVFSPPVNDAAAAFDGDEFGEGPGGMASGPSDPRDPDEDF
jgi:hypothetical protein